MRDARDGPFLCERVQPFVAVPVAGKRLDVLHDARVLVVGLFDQKGIVLDGGRRLLPEGCCRQKEDEREFRQRFSVETSRNPGGTWKSSAGAESVFRFRDGDRRFHGLIFSARILPGGRRDTLQRSARRCRELRGDPRSNASLPVGAEILSEPRGEPGVRQVRRGPELFDAVRRGLLRTDPITSTAVTYDDRET